MRLGEAVGYRSAGTVEFVYDVDAAQFYFLEVNTRLQVEHGVTEEVGGVDLVEWMIRTAAGEPPDLRRPSARAARSRHPGARVCRGSGAEFPARERPADRMSNCPPEVRVDGWVETGTEVSAYYDPLLAKIIARGATRERRHRQSRRGAAARRASTASRPTCPTCVSILANPVFAAGEQTTALLVGHSLALPGIEVLCAGHADHRAGLAGTHWASGTWACRPRVRWIRWRTALGQSHGRQCRRAPRRSR